jgi:hypothetical protein
VPAADEKTVDGVARIERAQTIGKRIIVLSAYKISWQWSLRHDQEYLHDLTTGHIKGCHAAIWIFSGLLTNSASLLINGIDGARHCSTWIALLDSAGCNKVVKRLRRKSFGA